MINYKQAQVLSQILMDYADNNLNNWESYGGYNSSFSQRDLR